VTGPGPIRVAGVGSPLGDDAVGWEVVRALRTRVGDQPGVELHELGGGHGLLDVLDSRGTLILVDAVMTGLRPGTIHRFAWPDPRVECLRPGSTHDLTPAAALRLGEALGVLPPRVVVYGIGIGQLNAHANLSPAVAAAAAGLADRIAADLTAESRMPPEA
jgi:hydrogenase maturation protease